MSEDSEIDRVFSRPLSDIKAFEFNASVARVFRDMISRSVPGYELLLRLIGLYANVFVTENSKVYDLGCSLGEASVLISERADVENCSVIAIDNSPSMISRCRASYSHISSIEWICDDILDTPVSDASMVVLNLTLQFIDPEQRQSLLNKIYNGLQPGGVLVLSEKVEFDQPLENKRMIELHQAFKKMQGYTELEISQKRTALENVLVSDLESELQKRFERAGFSEVFQCVRCFNFVSYLAIKS